MVDWRGIDLRQCVAAIRRLWWPLRGQARSHRFCVGHNIAVNTKPCGSGLARDGVISYEDESTAVQCC